MIETPRLRLRRFSHDDLDDFVRLYSDPEVVRFWPHAPSRADVERQLSNILSSYAERGYGGWVTALHDGTFLGRVGLHVQFVGGMEEIEVGYVLRREFWGQGYASEAARASRDWGFLHLSVARIISLIRPENLASIGVAKHNGMERIGATTHAGVPHDIYAIARTQWEALGAG